MLGAGLQALEARHLPSSVQDRAVDARLGRLEVAQVPRTRALGAAESGVSEGC